MILQSEQEPASLSSTVCEMREGESERGERRNSGREGAGGQTGFTLHGKVNRKKTKVQALPKNMQAYQQRGLGRRRGKTGKKEAELWAPDVCSKAWLGKGHCLF